jgi:SAM-dependent methyltransferase
MISRGGGFMKITEEKYNRYGEKEYDSGYVNWGFDSLDEQMAMAEKIYRLLPPGTKSILDMACGIGRYHQVWLKHQLKVTGVDVSETFIEYAREYNKEYADTEYMVCGFDDFDRKDEFDAAAFTDPVLLMGKAANNIYSALHKGGRFVFEMWNDNYYKYHTSDRQNNNQTWSCNNGVYR